jgi:transposase
MLARRRYKEACPGSGEPPCLIGMEACVGAHHLSRKLRAQGHDARLMPAKYVRPYRAAT